MKSKDQMKEFPFELLIEDGVKKSLRSNRKHLKIGTQDYIVEIDRSFCSENELKHFIERVDKMMAAGKVIKEGGASCVSRLIWNGFDIVVKRYNHQGLVHSLRHTLKKSRSRRAWLHGHRLGMLEIPTPKPLAYIEHRKRWLVWKSYLVTEYIDGRKLDSFLQDKSINKDHRLAVIHEVMKLLDKLWKHHITHGDLKHTNLLITKNGPFLTDLDGMIIHRWKGRYKNKQAKDVERFLREKNGLSITHIGLEGDFQKLTGCYNKIRIGGWIIHIREDVSTDTARDLLSMMDSSANNESRFERVPSSDYTRVFTSSLEAEGIPCTVYVKQYLHRSKRDVLKHLLRASRAQRACDASLMLQANGFDAPEVMGLFERRLGPLCVDNFLVTKEVEGAQPIPELFADMCRNSTSDSLAAKRTLIKSFAKTVGQMHAKGIFHGDLRLGNVLARKEEQKWRFFLIDNERTKKFHHLPARLRLVNLVQVNMFLHGISNTDRLRFFKHYLDENPDILDQKSIWINKITTKTSQRLHRKGWLEKP